MGLSYQENQYLKKIANGVEDLVRELRKLNDASKATNTGLTRIAELLDEEPEPIKVEMGVTPDLFGGYGYHPAPGNWKGSWNVDAGSDPDRTEGLAWGEVSPGTYGWI